MHQEHFLKNWPSSIQNYNSAVISSMTPTGHSGRARLCFRSIEICIPIRVHSVKILVIYAYSNKHGCCSQHCNGWRFAKTL